MYHQPYYRNYPPNVTYNPYLHSSYQRNNPFQPIPIYDSAIPPRSAYYPRPQQQQQPQPQHGYPTGELSPQEAALQQERARALAERRARRAQYLPDEDDDSVGSDEEWEYNQLGPRERAYVDARRRGEALERQRIEQEKMRLREAELARKREEEEAEMRRIRVQELRKQEEERRRQVQQRQRDQQELQERLARQRQQAQQQQQQRSTSRGPAKNDNSIPINVKKAPSTSQFHPSTPKSQPQAPPRPPTPKKFEPTIVYGSDHQDAATKIQRQYRIHQSYKALAQYAKQFEELKNNFAYPCNIDFQKPGTEEGAVTVRALHPPSDYNRVEKEREEAERAAMEVENNDNEDVEMAEEEEPTFDGKLAYTSTNYNLHQYSDSMDKLLMKLDGVESWGCKGVRERRRGIVKSIGREAARLDWYWREAWLEYVRQQGAGKQEVPSAEPQEGTNTVQPSVEEKSDAMAVEQPSISAVEEQKTTMDEEPMQQDEEPPVQDSQGDGDEESESTAPSRLPIVEDIPQSSDQPRKIPVTVSARNGRMEN